MEFMTTSIKTLVSTDGHEELVDLDMVPYGNAYESQDDQGNWEFQCQHGETECKGNLIESCAVNLLEKVAAHKFVVCLEEREGQGWDAGLTQCLTADQQKEVKSCTQSTKGNQYEHEMAVKTDALSPPHQWVPWVVRDSQPDSSITDTSDIFEYLCSKREDRSEIAVCTRQDKVSRVDGFLLEKKVCFREFKN